MIPVATIIRALLTEVEVKKKVYTDPKIKPPRRNPAIDNKTNRSDYMKNYMTEYREQGKDYQKVPDKVKEYRKRKRKELRERLQVHRPLQSALIDQELSFWKNAGKPVKIDEFDFICSRRGFNEDEWKILAEELIEENLFLAD